MWILQRVAVWPKKKGGSLGDGQLKLKASLMAHDQKMSVCVGGSVA